MNMRDLAVINSTVREYEYGMEQLRKYKHISGVQLYFDGHTSQNLPTDVREKIRAYLISLQISRIDSNLDELDSLGIIVAEDRALLSAMESDLWEESND